MTKAAARAHLMEAIKVMPDEAFGWLALACQPSAMLHGANVQIWPDGTGGFTRASRDAITAARAAAAEYINATE